MQKQSPAVKARERKDPSPSPGMKKSTGGEERFRSLAETTNDAIFLVDSGKKVIFWNRAAEKMFGYPAGEMEGRPLTTIIPERFRRSHEKGVARVLTGDLGVSGKSTEITGLKKDGLEFPLELTLAHWSDDDGSFLTGVARDITERRRTEQMLLESEKRYRSLFVESPIALWEEDFTEAASWLDSLRRTGVTDFRHYFETHPEAAEECASRIRVVDVNRAAMNLYNAGSREDLVGGLKAVMDEESEMAYREVLIALAEGETLIEQECVTRTLKGERKTVFLRGVVAEGQQKFSQKLLLSITDLTSHRKLESQFLQAQKMEAVGRLASGVAHDFNNLMAVIMTNSELLLRRVKDNDAEREEIVSIRQTSEKAMQLTRQLLTVSRHRKLTPTSLNLNDIIRGMQSIFPHLIGKQIQCRFDLREELGRIRAERSMVEQVILNLVVNARDAMFGEGTLTIATDNVFLDRETDTLAGQVEPGDYVMLVVTDTGEGIAPDVRSHIFEPFYTTKEEGSGLGLSTVYGIVKQFDGYIETDSSAGHGASFKIYLPREASPPSRAAHKPSHQGGS